ncbi:MAG: putative zinc-binding protein [Thermoplasmata archaeon]
MIVIPCSGIGKSLGSVTREVAYNLQRNRKDVKVLCLGSLTAGDEKSISEIRDKMVFTIDGCKKFCAQKNVEHYSGKLAKSTLVLDYLKDTGLNPKGVIELNDDGKKLVKIISDEISKKIDGV